MAEVGRIQIEVDARQVDKATRALNDLGLKAQATGRKVDGYEKQAEQATKATSKMTDSSRKLTRMFGLLSAGIGGLTFIGLARSIERATTQLNNIEATMRVATGSSQAAGQQIAFIREESERLGLFFPTVAKQMAQFSAAARGTTITSKELKLIFTGISEASRAMGLTAPEAEGAMKALQQMMSKGKVSAEELRQQLGERMPGSIQIMARSLDVTTQELFKMMENGELLSDEVLPKFARELSKTFSGEASQQAERIAASIQRLQTAFFNLMSQGDLSGASNAINELAETISQPEFEESFDAIIKGLSDLLGAAASNIDALIQLTKLLGILVSIRVAKWAAATVGGLNGIKTAASFLAGPAGLLALVATGLFKLGSEAEKSEKFLLDLGDAAGKLKDDASELDEELKTGLLPTLDRLLMAGESLLLEGAESLLDSMFPDDVAKLEDINKQIAIFQNRIPEGGQPSRFIKHELERLREERQALLQAIALTEIEAIEESGLYDPKRGRDRLSRAQQEAKAVKELTENQKEAIEILSKYDDTTAAALKYRDSVVELNSAFETLNLSSEQEKEILSDVRENYLQNINANKEVITSYERLKAKYDETTAATNKYKEAVADITANVDDPEKIAELIGLAKEEYIDATTEAKKLGDESSKAAEKIEEDFNRVADTIESAFTDVFFNIFRNGEFSFQNLASNILDIYARMLAEMATQQIITPIIRPQMQGGGQAVGGGQGAGVGPADLLDTVTQPGIGGQAATTFAKSNVGQSLGLSQTIQGGRGAMGGKVGAGAAPVELTKTGSNVASTASAATSLAGMGGNLVGTAIGGGTMEASMGATAGQVIGAAIGGPLAPITSFIGGVLGGAVGGALGDDGMKEAIREQRKLVDERRKEVNKILDQNAGISDLSREREKQIRREKELESAINENNRMRIKEVHMLEDLAQSLEKINRVNEERSDLERRYLNQIGDTAALRQLELDATESANRGILSFIFSLEDAAKKVQETESNAREAFRALQNTVRREQDAIEERLSGPIDALNSALDSLEGRTLTQRPRLSRTQAQTSLSLAREEGIDTLSERNLERALDVVAEPSQQLFGSFTDYQRDFKQTETLVRELRDDAERQRNTQLGALQAQLDQGREQLNALFGINDSVLTVSQAMNNLGASISAAQSAQQSFASISAPENAPSFEQKLPVSDPNARGYLMNNPDVLQAYQSGAWVDQKETMKANGYPRTLDGWALYHFENAGIFEGREYGPPAFAEGGIHDGGLRMVGERGPELEVTGPSRIYSNNDTRKMMGTDEMIDEIRSLREEVGELRREQGESQYQITRNTKRTRDTLEKFDIDGLPAERT